MLPGGAAQDGDQVQRARLLQLVGQLCRRVSLELELSTDAVLEYKATDLPQDKMNCTMRFGKQFSESSLSLPWEMAQGSGVGASHEL